MFNPRDFFEQFRSLKPGTEWLARQQDATEFCTTVVDLIQTELKQTDKPNLVEDTFTISFARQYECTAKPSHRTPGMSQLHNAKYF